MNKERLYTIRCGLGTALALAGTNVNTNTKDTMVLEYWYTCRQIDKKTTLERIHNLDIENAIDIIKYFVKIELESK